ncbi:MAG: putative zinc-binding metallopeptidase [Solibacillus sp.]
MKFMHLFLLAFIISLVTGCSLDDLDDYDQAVADDGEAISKPLLADEELEFVELLIDGGCKDGEIFNEEDESCSVVIDCNGEDCALWGDNLALELEENYGSLTEENSHIPDFDGLDVLVQYDVDLDEETIETDANVTQETIDQHASLWYSYAWLIPEYARTDMTKFEVFDSGDTLAHVYLHDDYDTDFWTLGMNRTDLEYASDTILTYIHEFAHLLSLRNTEVDYDAYADEALCEGVFFEDYCFYDNAYLADYYNQFYADGHPEENYENFISDYAMTSVIEDFAETFAHYVLSPTPEGDTIAEQKKLFFQQYNDLVELRANILGRTATWLDRTVSE